jgi:HAE1 family hydrophobic/amphiphilic exporter-1
MTSLTFAMRYRLIVAALALGVIAAAVPLYSFVKQEYIPSDIDEAEFDVNVTAPESASIAAMDEVMRVIETDLQAIRGVRLTLASAGGNFLGAVNEGRVYVRLAPHEERTFSLTRLWRSLWQGNPLTVFQGNYT